MLFTGIFLIWTHFFHFFFSLPRIAYTDLNIYSEFYCKTYPKFSTPTHFCNYSLRFKSFNSKNFLSISLSFAGSSVWFYTEIILLSNLLHFKDETQNYKVGICMFLSYYLGDHTTNTPMRCLQFTYDGGRKKTVDTAIASQCSRRTNF